MCTYVHRREIVRPQDTTLRFFCDVWNAEVCFFSVVHSLV